VTARKSETPDADNSFLWGNWSWSGTEAVQVSERTCGLGLVWTGILLGNLKSNFDFAEGGI
jgi:hypothetical protein